MQLHHTNDGRTAVLHFADLGFKLVPVHGVRAGACTCRKASACKKKGKHPKAKQWQQKGSCDHQRILRWWKPPFPNVGVVTGSVSGIVVVDVDGEEGLSTLEELAKNDESIRNTRIHRTGSGGLHLFYQYPDFTVGNSVELLPGIDIRGDAGLIVLPPSIHASGGQYETVDDREIAALPMVFRSMLSFCHKETQGETRNDKVIQGETRQVGGGVEDCIALSSSLLSSSRSSCQLEWAVTNSLPRQQGIRNKQVFRFAQHLFTIPGVTKDTPLLILRPIVEYWFQLAQEKAVHLGFSIRGDIEETWSDFVYAWGKVEYAIGGELASVFDVVAEMDGDGEVNPLVWDVLEKTRRTELPEMRLLIGVLCYLSQLNADEPFSLACHAGAEQCKRLGFAHVDGKWILRRLNTLTAEGVLVCVDRGKSGPRGLGQAAKYKWTWNV